MNTPPNQITVIGIPARNEGRTVSAVAQTADTGLHEVFPHGNNIIMLSENGSTDDTVARFTETPLRSKKLVTRNDGTNTGKGTNLFAIFDKALALNAARVLLLDADVRSTEPRWVSALTKPVMDNDEPTVAVPVYRRNRYEANTTNHLASPLLNAVYGTQVQQPIGGEFAFNQTFLERALTWPRPESASLYGVDVWLIANALREGLRVVEVDLGRKVHTPPFKKVLHMPQQVIDALFHVVLMTRQPMQQTITPAPRSTVDSASTQPDQELISGVKHAVQYYIDAHRDSIHTLFPITRQLQPAPWGWRISTTEWPFVLADALSALELNFSGARDHLIALYVHRIFSFWDEIEHLGDAKIDTLIDQQASQTALKVQQRQLTWTGITSSTKFDVGHWANYNNHTVHRTGKQP